MRDFRDRVIFPVRALLLELLSFNSRSVLIFDARYRVALGVRLASDRTAQGLFESSGRLRCPFPSEQLQVFVTHSFSGSLGAERLWHRPHPCCISSNKRIFKLRFSFRRKAVKETLVFRKGHGI